MSEALQNRNGDSTNFTEFGIRTDHRKKRRNRATQSCLHCHTNKRKCDRKRPCRRCIQLGMTGLCIYEVEDPDVCHDPNVAETTRLQNRIAELEILVRELRGKPHPRWTNTVSDRNIGEFWHSGGRSQKDPSRKKVALNLDPAPLQFPVENVPIFTVDELEYQHEFPPSPSQMAGGFEQHSLLTRSFAYLDSQASDSPTSQSFDTPFTDTNSLAPYCPSCACLANSTTRASLEFLVNQIQGTLHRLQRLPEHARVSQCPIYQIIELNSILRDALQSARFDGHSNVSASHDRSLPGLASPHDDEEAKIWGSTHSKDAYSPYFS